MFGRADLQGLDIAVTGIISRIALRFPPGLVERDGLEPYDAKYGQVVPRSLGSDEIAGASRDVTANDFGDPRLQVP